MSTATGTDHSAAHDQKQTQSSSQAGVTITALATGFVMASLDVTVVNLAGAAIQKRLAATLTEITWVVDGYVLTFAALLLLAGGVANRIGAKSAYLTGMAVFFIASLGCSLAPSAEVLIGARLLQGAGAALFMPSSLSLLVHAFPDTRQRTKMLGLWSAIVATSAGLGPTIGGLMVNTFGWRSIFLLNLPIGLAGIVLTVRYIARVPGRATRLTASGHAVLITGLAAVSYVLIEGHRLGWTSAPVLTATAIALLTAIALILRERSAANQIMPWSLFQNPRFSGANLIGLLFNFSLYGSMFMLGLFLQHARGASPWEAGLQLLPMTVFFPLANIVFSRISARFANGTLLMSFLLLAGLSSLTMVTVSAATPYWVIAVAIGAANIGAGIISPAMTAVLVDAAGREHANTGGSVLNANRQIGSLLGIAAMGLSLQATQDWNRGAALSFLLAASAYLAAAIIAWRRIVTTERRQRANQQPG